MVKKPIMILINIFILNILMSTKQKLAITIFILIGIFLVLFLISFSSGKPINETVKNGALGISSFFAQVPKAQIFFYAILALITSIIILYNSVQKTYGLPDNSLSFITDTPFDCRNQFTYIDSEGNKINYIPSKDIPLIAKKQITYGFWLYVSGSDNGVMDPDNTMCGNDWSTCNFGHWKHLLHYGSEIKGGVSTNQTPGIWLSPKQNNLVFIFNTDSDGASELITLDNIDVNKWLHVTLSLNNNSVNHLNY